ncbi:hypothetical protein FDECE_11111 [Fusarium decemcellulare]|nr:hypothetical protein FDECE_11111 [Fusarium decemcellulare]
MWIALPLELLHGHFDSTHHGRLKSIRNSSFRSLLLASRQHGESGQPISNGRISRGRLDTIGENSSASQAAQDAPAPPRSRRGSHRETPAK